MQSGLAYDAESAGPTQAGVPLASEDTKGTPLGHAKTWGPASCSC